MTEWARFQKFTRRMRELRDFGNLNVLSPEVFSVMQPRTTNDPCLPNLNTLLLSMIEGSFVPFISLFLSPSITSIFLRCYVPDHFKATVASTVTTIPTLCPNLRAISLYFLSKDPMIIAAVSEMVLTTNRNTLQRFHVDSPLTEEANKVIYRLPNLRDLRVVIERGAPLPSVSLPNLTKLQIEYDDESGWPGLFHRATFGKLESVSFYPESEEIGDFLGTFERLVLSSSVQDTLSKFYFSTSRSWNPNYSSLLPFTRLVDLVINFSCDGICTSTVDDDIVISLSRTMPKLRYLKLGDEPCGELGRGVTAKGLVALALHCPDLQDICIHFQVASLSAPSTSPGTGRNIEPTGSWTNCALTVLTVGVIPMREELVLGVTLTLLRIFPRITSIYSNVNDEGWWKVKNAIHLSRQIVDRSSKHHPFNTP